MKCRIAYNSVVLCCYSQSKLLVVTNRTTNLSVTNGSENFLKSAAFKSPPRQYGQ
jgi:hypothetical protein